MSQKLHKFEIIVNEKRMYFYDKYGIINLTMYSMDVLYRKQLYECV